MITQKIKGDILSSKHTHIVFAVNTEGFNDAGFAGLVSRRFWPDLAITGPQNIGKVLEKSSKGKVFHAIVCHSLRETGWTGAAKVIKEGLDGIMVAPDEEIGVVMMGAGMVGQRQGADVEANLKAMEESKHKIVVYSL
jgi:hypothetical protein